MPQTFPRPLRRQSGEYYPVSSMAGVGQRHFAKLKLGFRHDEVRQERRLNGVELGAL